MASRNFTNFAEHLARARIDFGSDTIKCILVNAIPSESDLDTWDYRDDVTSEITGAGYTAGGFTVTATIGSIDAPNDRLSIDLSAADPTLTSATVSAVGCIAYKSTGVASTDPLICFVDFNGTVSSTSGNYTVDLSTPIYINTNI